MSLSSCFRRFYPDKEYLEKRIREQEVRVKKEMQKLQQMVEGTSTKGNLFANTAFVVFNDQHDVENVLTFFHRSIFAQVYSFIRKKLCPCFRCLKLNRRLEPIN